MLITKRILEAILYDTGAEIIEVEHPVISAHTAKFALWTDEDDAAFEAEHVETVWNAPDEVPEAYAAKYMQTEKFDGIAEIRKALSGKKLFLYVHGVEQDLLHQIAGDFDPHHLPLRLRFAVWEPIDE